MTKRDFEFHTSFGDVFNVLAESADGKVWTVVHTDCRYIPGEYWPGAYAGGGAFPWDATLNYCPGAGEPFVVRQLRP